MQEIRRYTLVKISTVCETKAYSDIFVPVVGFIELPTELVSFESDTESEDDDQKTPTPSKLGLTAK